MTARYIAPGVEVAEAQLAGGSTRDAGLAGARGTVDGDDEVLSAHGQAAYGRTPWREARCAAWSRRQPVQEPAACAVSSSPSRSATAGSTEISARPNGWPRPCSRCRSSRLTPASPTSCSSRASSPGGPAPAPPRRCMPWARHRACPGCGRGRRCPGPRSGPAPRGRRRRRRRRGRRAHRSPRSARCARARGPRAPPPALPARIWVHSWGSLAAMRVTSRIPWPARATAGSARSRSRPATSEDDELGHVGDRSDRGVVLGGAHRADRAARSRGQLLNRRDGPRCRRRRAARRPRPARRRGRRGRPTAPERSRPAIGCDPAYRRRSAPLLRTSSRIATLTDATSVTTASRPARERLGDDGAGHVGRRGHDDDRRGPGRLVPQPIPHRGRGPGRQRSATGRSRTTAYPARDRAMPRLVPMRPVPTMRTRVVTTRRLPTPRVRCAQSPAAE